MRKPHFLVRGLSPSLRRQLESQAKKEKISIQEVVRRALCDHYDMDCDPIKGPPQRSTRRGSLTILVKMQPELFLELKIEAQETKQSMQSLVHQALEARYVTERTPA